MDDIVFRSDTVLSDIHLHTPKERHLMVRLNGVGQPVFLSQFKLLRKQTDVEFEKKYKSAFTIENGRGGRRGDGIPLILGHNKNETPSKGIDSLLDADGDLEVVRRPQCTSTSEAEDLSREKVCPMVLMKGGEDLYEEEEQECRNDIIKIEHTMATPLEDVGKQVCISYEVLVPKGFLVRGVNLLIFCFPLKVWRGAFLLADYILFDQDAFRCRTLLELGGGTGLTSIIAATIAGRVYCTDVGEDLLATCEQNVRLNRHLWELAGSEVKVKELDWLKDGLCTDPEAPYSWSEAEIADMYNHASVILAADVFYDDDLTDAFFGTLRRLTGYLNRVCTIYLAIEKRLNFTLRSMDIACEAYNHFRDALSNLASLRDGEMKYTVEPVRLAFCQSLVYERIEQLELWKVVAEPQT
ncbi:PREDICTED: methyltransferase-like protein 22 isoform X1 [Gavialis gangeticus]|uniref:methyltransferase-like protein 22 isoform X1 n=1 Tax=Gavialis gangeticus TaxID=94835 RepID=UPI00092F618D|nr:PREDICTED: methyltransferase-like protein 22 isoform X1 [Gavialis gangeticus]XP_019363026.1 PREDICTED: methyltransferase-like protein 22 isoform X1 [Gavialis gangeticus]XP_019363027.1 PREDICTED: methyltransferase-like protein 22 isoform X1 [Gavialis gangeticus]